VLGVTLPTLAVRLKLGPKSAPKPELSVTNIFIFYIYSFINFYIEHANPHVLNDCSYIIKPGPADGDVDVN